MSRRCPRPCCARTGRERMTANSVNGIPVRELSRRQFIKGSAAAFSAALLVPELIAGNPVEPAAQKKRDIKKAMMLTTVPGGGSLASKFNRIKAAGFDGVEVRGNMDRDAVLKARDAAGLQIPSVYCAAL